MPPPLFPPPILRLCLALVVFLHLFYRIASHPCTGIQTYLITFDYNWSPETDKSFPTTDNSIVPGFSPLICATHGPDYSLWQSGSPISAGVRTLLTNVSNEGIEDELEQAKLQNRVFLYLPVSQENATADSTNFLTLSVEGEGNFTLISCIAKVIPSADWFVGLSGIDTCKNGSFIANRSGKLFGWDGGIDNSEAYDESFPQPTSEAVQVLPSVLVAPEGYGHATIKQTVVATPSPSPPVSDSANGSGPVEAQPPQPFVPNFVDDQMLEEAEPDRVVCVDAAALSHLPPNSLLYAEHRMARVLCDPHASCATPGHMVYFRNIPMMMMSYCRLTHCIEHLMYVNSPRYSRALRISSKTPDLQFTALAARYTTAIEEHIMSFALRIGL